MPYQVEHNYVFQRMDYHYVLRVDITPPDQHQNRLIVLHKDIQTPLSLASNVSLQNKRSVRRLKFDWLWKRCSKRTQQLWQAKGDWCASTGLGVDGWREEMVDRIGLPP